MITNHVVFRNCFTSYHNILSLYPLVLIVEFVMTEFNVSENDGTVEIVLEANGTSQFDYFVTLSIGDIGTGENITLSICIICSYYNVFKHACIYTFVHTCARHNIMIMLKVLIDSDQPYILQIQLTTTYLQCLMWNSRLVVIHPVWL